MTSGLDRVLVGRRKKVQRERYQTSDNLWNSGIEYDVQSTKIWILKKQRTCCKDKGRLKDL
jgi:hypothetical protein